MNSYHDLLRSTRLEREWNLAQDVAEMKRLAERGTRNYTDTYGASSTEVNLEPVTQAVREGTRGVEKLHKTVKLIRGNGEDLLEAVDTSRKLEVGQMILQGLHLAVDAGVGVVNTGIGLAGLMLMSDQSEGIQTISHLLAEGNLDRREASERQGEASERQVEELQTISLLLAEEHLDRREVSRRQEALAWRQEEQFDELLSQLKTLQRSVGQSERETQRHHDVMEQQIGLIGRYLRKTLERQEDLFDLLEAWKEQSTRTEEETRTAIVDAIRSPRENQARELFSFAQNDRRIGNTSSAIRNVSLALEQKSDFPEAWFEAGTLALHVGRTTDARNAFSLCQKYAEWTQQRELEVGAINCLLLLERMLENETAELGVTLLKWKRGFPLDGIYERFMAMRARLLEEGEPIDLEDNPSYTSPVEPTLKRQLPELVRHDRWIGWMVAGEPEFTNYRHYMGNIETFGSWVYIFNDLQAIRNALERKNGLDAVKSMAKTAVPRRRKPYQSLATLATVIIATSPEEQLLERIKTILAEAPNHFEDGTPVSNEEGYDRLFEKREVIRNALNTLHTDSPCALCVEDLDLG